MLATPPDIDVAEVPAAAGREPRAACLRLAALVSIALANFSSSSFIVSCVGNNTVVKIFGPLESFLPFVLSFEESSFSLEVVGPSAVLLDSRSPCLLGCASAGLECGYGTNGDGVTCSL